MRLHLLSVLLLFGFSLGFVPNGMGDELPVTSPVQQLEAEITPLLSVISGKSSAYQLTVQFDVPIDGKPQQVRMKFARFDDSAFDLELAHKEYAVSIYRRKQQTAFLLPLHQTAYVAEGSTHETDHIAPGEFLSRLVSEGSECHSYLKLSSNPHPKLLATLLTQLGKLTYDARTKRWQIQNKATLQFSNSGREISLQREKLRVDLQIQPIEKMREWDQHIDAKNVKVTNLKRTELEGQLARGFRRALEILMPSQFLRSPAHIAKKVSHGELRWVEGQRVVLLRGTPEQIGHAHGQLLKSESERCMDSVLNTFGTIQTIRTGRWFRHDLDAAYARLSPHIPDDHKRETKALAESLGTDPKLVAALNVFPELFHCSGFAVFGSATKEGKLYHGRVLDYMTTIGLQDSATTFIVHVDGKIPFANIGYAGFIGSVSGMNAKAISLGEMGGRGEGQWDGAPMATLMRRALEECETLDEVMTLWKTNPRTCEYYYVFADGKTNQAVGVAATPEKIEFIKPGQTHPRLGEGIADTVVLSAGSRLAKLRERVSERHGKLTEEDGLWLMSRPVAMKSNLHNVLFVPVDGVFYVANASHKKPAAECKYVKLNLRELLDSFPLATAAN